MSALIRDAFIQEMWKTMAEATSKTMSDTSDNWHLESQLGKYRGGAGWRFTKSDQEELLDYLIKRLDKNKKYNEEHNIEIHNLRIDVAELKKKNKKLRKKLKARK
jgi:hypothetical protein